MGAQGPQGCNLGRQRGAVQQESSLVSHRHPFPVAEKIQRPGTGLLCTSLPFCLLLLREPGVMPVGWGRLSWLWRRTLAMQALCKRLSAGLPALCLLHYVQGYGRGHSDARRNFFPAPSAQEALGQSCRPGERWATGPLFLLSACSVLRCPSGPGLEDLLNVNVAVS